MSGTEQTDNDTNKLLEAVDALSAQLGADIILFNEAISERAASRLHARLEGSPNNNETVFLMLVTLGGDAHAAYMIARDLQMRYKKVIICIAGDCFSAGTLIVLCANELVITDRGRLGPLDVQLLKKDELSERLSGLTVNTALEELHKQTSDALASIAIELRVTFGRQLSFRTALDVASNMTAQMFGEVYKQIDPIRLGEDARSLRIADHYGTILGKTSSNLKPGTVNRLSTGYPSHECIIDRTEARELFLNLRGPSDEEANLLKLLGPVSRDAMEDGTILVFPTTNREENDERQDSNGATENGATQRRSTTSKPRSSEVLAGGNGTSGATDTATNT